MWMFAVTAAFGQAPAFHRDLAPLLAFHCNRCHGDSTAAGGLDTRSHAGLMRGGALGPAVIPGDPAASPLMEFLEGRRGEPRRMPLEAAPLPADAIALFRRWIADGAREDKPSPPDWRSVRDVPRAASHSASWSGPARGYLVLRVLGRGGQELFRDAAITAPDRATEFRFDTSPRWPPTLRLEAELRYAAVDSAAIRWTVDGR